MLSDQDKQNLAAGGFDEKAARSPSPRMRSVSPGHTAVGTTEPPRSTTPFSLSGRTPTLFKRASRAPTVIPRSQAISRRDLIESAERIYYRYLSPVGAAPGSNENHEIYLPPALRIHSFPLSSTHDPKTQTEISLMAQIPDMFHAQKEYCYRAMEQDAFPRFLRAKAFGNLTPVSALVRLIAGLVILWIGLAAGFSLIFLDVQPKSKRFFVSPHSLLAIFRLPSSPSRSLYSSISNFSADPITRTALHPIHARHPLPHLAPIRARPCARLPRPVRVHAVPDTQHPRAVREEAPARPCHLGLRAGRRLHRRADHDLLGRARAPAVTVSPQTGLVGAVAAGRL